MQSRQTGKREMLVRGEPQRRQSDGTRVANAPLATVVAPEISKRSRGRFAKWPERTVAALWGGETGVRVMSPILLKTSLPRPAPGQAPAGRILFSIAGSDWAINYSGSQAARDRTTGRDSRTRALANREVVLLRKQFAQ